MRLGWLNFILAGLKTRHFNFRHSDFFAPSVLEIMVRDPKPNPPAQPGAEGRGAPQSNPAPVAANAESSPFTPPSINLPKGGGAIKGIGEKFAANPVTGTGSLSVPLPLSPGRGGFTPVLSLSYDSGAGNGPFGFGWSIGLPIITRKTDKGLPRYFDEGDEESDVFVLSGAEDLVRVLENSKPKYVERSVDGQNYRVYFYRPRIEGLFARIERWVNQDNGEIHWRSISKDNITTLYGKTLESRIANPADPKQVFSWLVCESYNDKGNSTVYEYFAEDAANIDISQAHQRNRNDPFPSSQRYLKRVKYGNTVSRLDPNFTIQNRWLFELVLDYNEDNQDGPAPQLVAPKTWRVRPDPFSSYRSGFEVRTYRRCQRVLMFHHFPQEAGVGNNCLVRSLEFDYQDFDYTQPFTTRQELEHPGSNRIGSMLRRFTVSGYKRKEGGGYTKRSMPPLELSYTRPRIAEVPQTLEENSYDNLPIGVDGRAYQWVDLYSEGLSGVLSEQADSWFYKPNLGGGKLGATQAVLEKPSMSLQGGAQLMDLAGDGSLDLVSLNRPVAGFFENALEGWDTFTPFEQQPNLRFDDPKG